MKYLLFLLLPKELLSRFLGWMEHWESPRPLIEWMKRWFVGRYKLNMAEAEKPLEEYRSLNDLFTRHLKPGLRPILSGQVHPCDAVITQCGALDGLQLTQVKGWSYSASELVGEELGKDFSKGSFATYYLCPTDYHRVHFPLSGNLVKVRHLVGKLWPVNEWSVQNVKNLFCLNERLVFELRTTQGVMFLVMVGATNVGHITTPFVPDLQTNLNGDRKSKDFSFESPVTVNAGDEAGIFQMGSTVILVCDESLSGRLKFEPGVTRMGQPIC